MVRTTITKEEPSRELKFLRQRVTELEALEAEHQQADKKPFELDEEQKYKAVFESANDAIVLMDKKGRVTDVNDKLREILGYDREKLVGKNLSSLPNIITKKSLDILSDNFQKRVAGAHVPPYEIEMVQKNGELLTLEVNARAMKKDGRIIGNIAILRDVTERKRTEDEIRDKIAEIQLINSINDAINRGSNLKEVIQLVATETQKLFGGNAATIYLLSEDKQHLVMQNFDLPPKMVRIIEKIIGKKIPAVRIPLKAGSIYSEMLKTGKAQLTNDPLVIRRMASECTEDKTLFKLVPRILQFLGVRSVISVPLVSGDQEIGLMDISRHEPFTETDMRRLQTISSQLVNVIKRKQTEEALAGSEERLRTMMEASSEGFALHDGQKVFDINENGARMFGYERSEMVGENAPDFVAPESLDLVLKNIAANYTQPYEALFKRKDGSTFPVELMARSITFKGRDIRLVSFRDLTAQKQHENLLETIVVHAPVSMYIAQDGRFKFVNKQFCRDSGYTEEELLAMDVMHGIHPEDRALVRDNTIRMLKGERTEPYQFRTIDKNGEVRWVLQSVSPITYNGQRASLATYLDITERKQAEAEYKTIIQTTIDGFWLADMQGRFLNVNDAYCQFIGYNRDELLKMSISDIEAIEKPEETAERIARIKKVGGDRFETCHRCKDGSIVNVEVSVNYIDAGGGRMFVFIRDITERKRAELALRMSEQNLKEAQSLGRIGSWEFDLVTQQINWSDETYRLYERDQTLGPPSVEEEAQYYTPEQTRKVREYALLSVETGKEYNYDLTANLPSGNTLSLNASVRPIKDEQGQVTKLFGTVQDMTERKQAEQALRASESKYRFLSENMADIAFTVDLNMRTTYVSPSVERVLGFTPEERMRQLPQEQLTPESFKSASETLSRELEKEDKTGEPNNGLFVLELEYYHKDGSIRIMETNLLPIRDEQGKPTGVYGLCHDITERKKVEDALKVSEERFRRLAENARDIIFRYRNLPSLGFDYISPAVLRISGYAPEEFYTDPLLLFKVVHPDSRSFLEEITSRPQDYLEKPVVLRWIHKNGETIWTEQRSVPVYDKDGKIIAIEGIQRDVTERKQMEEEVQRNYDTQTVVDALLKVSLEDLPLEEILRRSLDLVLSIPWLTLEQRGAIFLVEGEPNVLVMKAQSKLAEPIQKACARMPFGRCLCGRAALTNETQFADCLDERHETRYEGINPHGHYCVPITFGGEVLGVINTYIKEGHRRDNREEVFLTGVANTLAGIIERKRTEEILRESEENLQTYLDNAPEGVCLYDLQGVFVYGNNMAEEILGYRKEELIGESFLSLNILPAKYLAKAVELLAFNTTGRVTGPDEFELIKKDGNHTWVEISTTPIKQKDRTLIISFVRDINDHKRASEALKTSEENYRHSIDSSPMGMVVFDGNQEILYANQAILDIYGFKNIEELRNIPIKERYTPESYAEYLIRNEKFRSGEVTSLSYELSIRRKDGTIRHLQTFRKEIIWDGKKQFQLLYNDITERKKAEDAIRESRARFRELARLLPLGIWETDENGTFTYTNEETMRAYGYSRQDTTAPPTYLQGLIPQDRDRAVKNTERLLQGETLGGNEYTALRKDGSTFPSMVYTSAIIRNGKGVGLRGITINTTEQKKAEKRLEQAAQEWRTTFDSITDMVCILDNNFRIVRVNMAYADMFKKEPQELLGKVCYELINRDCPHHDCPHQKTLKTGKPARAEFFEPTLGTYIEVSTSPIFNENGDIQGSVHVMRDISERKQMEQQLMLTDRLASVGELASGVAHELNNPLTSVIGFSQLLIEGEIPDNIKEDLSLINSEAQRAASIVKNLLTFARKHAAVKQSTKINNVIEDVLKLRAYEQKVNNIEVIKNFAPDLPEIMVDYFQIQQVFLNLIINAEFFMIEAHRRGTLTISIEKVDHAVKVSLADDGTGIPRENLKRIFDPFFTTKEVGKGTGLGLSICHGIITEHGGKIYAESEVGKGATFIIELPINGR